MGGRVLFRSEFASSLPPSNPDRSGARDLVTSRAGPGYGTSVLASRYASISSFTIDGSSEDAPPPYIAPLRAGVAGRFLAYSTPAAMSLTKRVATPGSVCGKVTHR